MTWKSIGFVYRTLTLSPSLFFFWQSVKVGGPQSHTIIRSFCICIFMFANSTSDMFQYDKCIKIRFLMNQGTIITLTWQGLYWGKITNIGQLLPMNKILTVIKLFYHFLFHAGGRGETNFWESCPLQHLILTVFKILEHFLFLIWTQDVHVLHNIWCAITKHL